MAFDTDNSTNAPDRLIIALDFGTTFSGVAYAFSTDPEKVYSITSWPGGDSRVLAKTPTTIKYDSRSGDTFKWGYELDQTLDDKITRFKLLLDPEERGPYNLQIDLRADSERLPKPAVAVASDYMRSIYQHALAEIEGDSIDPTFPKQFEKQHVLTVPAVWSDKAKVLTLQAAQNAGMSPVELITEPEAAALFTLEDIKYRGLETGDAIVVCDAGGGTVDLISYEITALQPFKLRALTAASGGIAGSLMVNKRFEEEVEKVVGSGVFAALKNTSGYRSALREFDTVIKPAFRGANDSCKYVSFPRANLEDNRAMGLERDAIALSGQKLVRIFDPVQDINKLVSKQVSDAMAQLRASRDSRGDAIKAIFLVGGFGSSVYLREVIRESNTGVRVIQPRDAWSAIVKGAVLSKLPQRATISSTRASKHYGTRCSTIWDGVRDSGQLAFWDWWDEIYRCTTMNWFIYMGAELPRENKISVPFGMNFSEQDYNRPSLIVDIILYHYTSPKAPRHPVKDMGRTCVLTTDLKRLPWQHFVKRTRASDKVQYRFIEYNLRIENNQSGLMKFSLEVGGKEYSAVEAAF